MSFPRPAKSLTAAAIVVSLTIVLAGSASAHVTVDGNAPKGGFGQFAFSVPNESGTASTTKVEVQLPQDTPLALVSAQAKAGWTVTITKRKLAKPITADGETVTEAVDTITWSGGKIGPGQYDTFGVSGGPFPTSVDQMVFKAIQTYSDGKEVAWIEPTPPGGQEPAHPAPTLTLTAASTAGSPGASPTPTVAPGAGGGTVTLKTKTDTSGVAVAALVAAVLALVLAAAALLTGRRRPTSP
ncbi:MAG: nuclear export factor [Acidimicrobiales bacterium]|nr:nuclear export factor [Acidimicrobiales bacterium]